MINFTIHRAIECWEKENKKKFDMWNSRECFASVIESLQSSIADWPFWAQNLLKISNWNIPRLTDKNGNIRLPKAYLEIYLTKQENLVLDWYPDIPAFNYIRETDFRYWSRDWDSGQLPFNRIVMIRDVGVPYIYGRDRNKHIPHSHKYLLQAIHEHVHFVIDTLKMLIDIELVSDLYFEYKSIPVPQGKYPCEVEREQLVSCEILTMKEINEREKQKWLDKTFAEMGLSADDFIKIFANVEGNKKKFAKMLKEKGIKGLGEYRAATIIEKLKKEFTEVYLRNYPEEMMNINSKVVSIHVNKQ